MSDNVTASVLLEKAEAVIDDLLAERERFVSFVRRRVNDRAIAEDLVQTAYARAVEHVGALRDESSARSWFYRVLRNAVIDFYRRRAAETAVIVSIPEEMDAAEPVKEDRNLCGCIDRAIDRLKPEYAEVLREVELGDGDTCAVAAYAERTGLTAGNAAVRAFRARKALAKSLEHTCGSCAGAGCLDCTCAQPGGTR